MEQKAGLTFSHSADYLFIDAALKARWEPFCALESELEKFSPKTVEDFSDHRVKELARLKAMNPASSDESLLEIIDGQIYANSHPGTQIYLRFSDRVMSEYVTVAFLAHALAEATINAILAIGLATSGAADLFALIERADIKDKWTTGPKSFHSQYTMQKGSALYKTLQHLTRQRNAFVHYKIEFEMGGEKKLRGSILDRAPLSAQLLWVRRFFSLPYDLASHALRQIPHRTGILLWDTGPIQRFPAHAEA